MRFGSIALLIAARGAIDYGQENNDIFHRSVVWDSICDGGYCSLVFRFVVACRRADSYGEK